MKERLRIMDIMTLSLTKDKLVFDEQLEIIVNSDDTIEEKEKNIKKTLKEIVLTEQLITKWGELQTLENKEEK